MTKSILVKQVRGTAQTNPGQKATLKALGLHGVGTSRARKDTRAIRGMLNKVQYWIEAKQVDSTDSAKTKKKGNGRGYTLG